MSSARVSWWHLAISGERHDAYLDPYVPHPGQTDKDRSIAPLLVAGSIE